VEPVSELARPALVGGILVVEPVVELARPVLVREPLLVGQLEPKWVVWATKEALPKVTIVWLHLEPQKPVEEHS